MAERDFESLVHIAVPILQVGNLSAEIGRMRNAIVASVPPDTFNFSNAKVSVVICTKDKGLLLHQLLARLLGDDDALIADVIIVSNQTTNAYARRTLRDWSSHPKVKVHSYDRSFNFSEQSNLGVAMSKGEFVLFLNDDIVPVTADWLPRLMAPFVDPTVGITGPLLLCPNEQVQHAGMYVADGAALHTLRHACLPDEDYLFLATCTRDVSMVTGAALLMRRSCFDDLNGFDAQLATIYQDVDLCLRVSKLDLRILYVPRAILLHMESVSLMPMIDNFGLNNRRREVDYFERQHGPKALASDRFHNPCFPADDPTLRALQI